MVLTREHYRKMRDYYVNIYIKVWAIWRAKFYRKKFIEVFVNHNKSAQMIQKHLKAFNIRNIYNKKRQNRAIAHKVCENLNKQRKETIYPDAQVKIKYYFDKYLIKKAAKEEAKRIEDEKAKKRGYPVKGGKGKKGNKIKVAGTAIIAA